jgi:translation elongation factor EF-Ts
MKVYPQSTAKRALASAIAAVQSGDTAYLVAHLMDPGFVDFRLADRAKQYEAEVEVALSRLRATQIRNPDKYAPAERLPTDRAKFAALIVEQSRERAFKQLVRDITLQIAAANPVFSPAFRSAFGGSTPSRDHFKPPFQPPT